MEKIEYIKSIYDTLTVEEKDAIIKMIEDRSCFNCTNTACEVPSIEKFSIDEDNEISGHNCLAWHNEEMIVKQKKLNK